MFQPGEIVAIAGRRGTFRVVRQDGDIVHVYGGDPDPRGRRMHRAVSVAQVRQPRERSVKCRDCHRTTFNLSGLCDFHDNDQAEYEYRRAEAHLDRTAAS